MKINPIVAAHIQRARGVRVTRQEILWVLGCVLFKEAREENRRLLRVSGWTDAQIDAAAKIRGKLFLGS